MRRTKPQGIFFSHDHFQHNDTTFKHIELCGVELQTKSTLRSILTDEHLELLGEIDENWFENATVLECSGVFEESKKPVSGASKKQQDETSISALVAKSKDGADNSHLCQQETPVRKDFKSTTSGLDSSPALFTPDQKGKTFNVTDGVTCHSTPSVNAESQTFSPLKWMGQDPDDNKVESSVKLPLLGISPLRDGVYNPREDTPQFLRNLLHLQTPSTSNRTQETLSMSAFQQTLPTPQRLSKSLGAEANDLNYSWTSSMATPFSARKTSEREATGTHTTSVTRGTDSPQAWKPIIAKVLFAASDKKTQKEPKSLQREGSSEPLPSLHFSSTEDEEEISDQEKSNDLHRRKRGHHLEWRKKDGSSEIKRLRKKKESKKTPLKINMEGLCEEKRKIGEDLEAGGNNLMKVKQKKDIKRSDLEGRSPEVGKQKIEEDFDSDGRKEVARGLEVKMEKGEAETFDHQLDGLHEEKFVKEGDHGDCDLDKKVENVEVDDVKEETDDQTEENVKCEERKEILEAGKMEIELKEIYDMEKSHMKKDVCTLEGQTECADFRNELEISTLVEEEGLEEVELHRKEETGNEMEVGCEQMTEGKESTETKGREQDLQQVQNELETNRAVYEGLGTSNNALTLDVAEIGDTQLEGKSLEEEVPQTPEDRPLLGCSIPKTEDISETVTSKSYIKTSSEEESSNTTLPNSTQNLHGKHIHETSQTPHQILQKDKACMDEVEDGSSVAVMSPSVEAGLYGRLAILAETLNIPLAQMIEADRKARKLQEAAMKKATPTNNHVDITSTYKPSHDINSSSQGSLLEEGLQERTDERERVGNELSSSHEGGRVGNELSSSREISDFEPKNEKEESKEERSVKSAIQTEMNSPQSLLPDGSQSNGSEKSSNIADTLAFFLATPPLMQKRKASLGQVPAASTSHCKELSKAGDGMGVSKGENMSEKGQSMTKSPPTLIKKDATSVTPPQVDSSPNACLFSPLTPSTTEALLRATDAVSSSLESSGESKDIEVNNNTCQKKEVCNLLEASKDNLKERQMENEAEMLENLLSVEPKVESAKHSSNKEEEKSSRLTKDGETHSCYEKDEKDLASKNILHEKTKEDGEKLDNHEKNIDSPVSFLKVGKNLSARRFLYPMSATKINVKPRLLTWQHNAVLDESCLDEGGKTISETTKEQLSEAGKSLESGAIEKKFLNRGKTGQFQTFNSFVQTELKESDRQGYPQRHEDGRLDEQFAEKHPKRTVVEIPNLSSRTRELCELNEGFLTDPPELIHVDGSFPSGVMARVREGGDEGASSQKMGPGGDASLQSHLCMEGLEEERRCMEESDEKKHQRRCDEEQTSPKGRKSKNSVQFPSMCKLSNDRNETVSQNAEGRIDLSNDNQETTAANGVKDVPAAKERHKDDLSRTEEGKLTHYPEASKVSSLTEQFATGDAMSVPNIQTNLPFVGFRSALGKKIEISATALEKAKVFMQELELDKEVVPKPSSKDFNSADVQNLKNLSSGNIEVQKNDMISSKFDSMDGKFNKSEKAVFVGFTSGTGKPIQISAKAMKDAEMLLEKFESEEQKIASSSEEWKSGDNCQESSDRNDLGHNSLRNTTTFASKNDVINEGGAMNENLRLSKKVTRQGGFAKPAQDLSKKYDPSKNYSHLPKGFRPFKPPARKLVVSEENSGTVQKLKKHPQDSLQVECKKQNYEDIKIPNQMQKEDIMGTRASSKDRFKTKLSDVDHGGFEEEENEAHIVREIAAAEEAEMLYDFMKDEDEIVDTQIDTLLTASTEEVKVLQKDRLTFDLRSQMMETGSNLAKVEKCQTSTGVRRNVCLSNDESEVKTKSARNFVQGEKQSATSSSHDRGDLRNVEQPKTSDISNGMPVEVNNFTGNTPTTHTMLMNSDESQVKEFVGFQTAKGTKIRISDEALVKAKMFLLEEDSEVSSNPSISSCSLNTKNDKAHEKLSFFHKSTRTSPEGDKKFDAACTELKSIQGEKRKSILKTGESKTPKKPKTADIPTVSSSFQTGNGKKVRFLEESLQNVRMEIEAGTSQRNDDKAHFQHNDGFGSLEDKERKNSFGNLKRTFHQDDIPQSSFTGFQTGNGKQVTISKEALIQARQAWCDEGLGGDCEIEGSVSNIALPKHGTPLSSGSPKYCSSHVAGHQSYKENENVDGPHSADGHSSIRDACSMESVAGVQTLKSELVNNCLSSIETSERMSMYNADHGTNFLDSGRRKIDEFRTEEKLKTVPAVLPSGPLGFQTARGVSIKLSESALEKAKKLWSEDETLKGSIQDKELNMYTKANSTEEATTSCPSKHHLFNQRKMALENLDKNLHIPSNQVVFSGFQTANGLKVKISDSSLEKAKNLLSDDVDDDRSIKSLGEMRDTQGGMNEGVETYMGFQTAKGAKVSISDAALERAQQFWSEEVLDSPKKQKSTLHTNEQVGRVLERNVPGKTYSGFQTGRGSKVKISMAALEKAKSLWSEDTGIDPPGKRRKLEGSPDSGNIQKESEASLSSFQSAKGSKVKISQEALEKTKSHWSDDEMTFQHFKKPQELEGNQTDLGRPAFSTSSGFQTANGSKIAISSTALEKAKKLLEDDEPLDKGRSKTTIENFPKDREKEHSNTSRTPKIKFCGFQTGNGAKVEISAAAMEKAKQLWTDNVDSCQDKKKETLLSTNQNSSRMISGFQTAKGSSVTVSQAALQKAQSLFKEEEENQSCSDFNKTAVDTFMTTNGEAVGGSKAVVQERQILKNSNETKECYPGKEKRIGPTASESKVGTLHGSASTPGFLTGRGKAVTISESSLREAKAKWNDQTNSGSLNVAEKFVSLPHKETVLPAGVGMTLKQTTTQGRCSTSSVIGEETEFQVLEKTWEDSTFMQEERRVGMGNVFEENKEGTHILNMTVPAKSEDQLSARGQSASVDGLKPADMRGRTRHCHTSQFTSKMQKGASPSSSSVAYRGSNHLPQRRSPASVLSDRITHPHPLVSSCSSESTIREPPANARVFKKRVQMETSDKEKGHQEIGLRQVWQKARISQLRRIQDKKKTVIKPKPGYLSKHRKGKQRVSLREAVEQTLPNHYSEEEILSAGVLPSTINNSAQSSSSYRFKAGDFFSYETLASREGILLGDGGRLVPADDGTGGAEEFKNALFDTPGVDPALVSSDWVENHFRWIVWKLASMEVAYPTQFGGRLLTPDRVLLQLKHRYDREIDQSQRSALKKILERDEVASRRLVLCVAGMLEPQSLKEGGRSDNTDEKSVKDTIKNVKQCCHLLLTDGWYAVKTIIDTPLATQVESKKICIGTKLCLSGGELVGSQEACSPLEIPESLFFRISYNSTRRAKFDARLGIQKDPRPFPIPLKSICGNGGTVGCVDIIIARVYPMQYMEKYPEGSSVFRSLRTEERAAAEFSKAKQRRMEMLYSQIQKKYEEKKTKESLCKKVKRSHKLTQEEVNAMTTGEELYTALTSSLDPGFLESCLTPRQVGLLQDYQRTLQEKQNQGMQEELRSTLAKQETENSLERKVVSLIKIRIADYYGRQKGNPPTTAMLTIWRPAEDLISQLTEGKRFQLTNLSASGARFQWNSSNAQLASSRSTRYLEKQTQEEILENVYRPREAASLQSLASGCHQSMYGEVDVVGLVAAVKGGSGGLQKVYLTDEHSHLVEVRFWNGLKSHHLEDVVQPGKFITASNLQVRGTETYVLHTTELSLFSMNPKSKLLQQSLVNLKIQVKDVKAILYLVEESIDQLTNWQKVQRPAGRMSNSTVSSSGYSSASNSFVTSPSEKDPQKKNQSDLGQMVTHHWVPYEGNLSTSPGTALQGSMSSTPNITPRSQFAKRTPQTNDNVSQFCRKNSATPNQILIADTSEENISAKKRDIQRRNSLLARIPSPPPLTPLPNYTPSSLKKEFRTPVRGSTSSSVPMLSFDPTQKTSAEKKTMVMSRNSELASLIAREESGCVLQLKDNVEEDYSVGDSLTATQAGRLEVCQLTEVEIKELAGSWSQPLSYSSSDEGTPEMKIGCKNGGIDEGKGKDGELHVPNDLEKHNSLEEESVTKKGSLCESIAGEENALILGGTKGCGGKSAQTGGRSLSRRKRERAKQEPVDVACTKRRKLSQDSCQKKVPSEYHSDSSKFLSVKDLPLEVKENKEVKGPSKPEIDRNVGMSEDEINVRTKNKTVNDNHFNTNGHASIPGETTKSQMHLSDNIQNVSHGNQALQSRKITEGNGFATNYDGGYRQMDERAVGDVISGKGEEQAHEVVNMTCRTRKDNVWSVKQNTISGRTDQANDLLMISNDDGNQAKEKEVLSENNSENTVSQMNESSSTTKKGGRKGRKYRRSNVNLALLDETNLQESPEHEGLSSRLRKRPRPSYKE